MGWDSKFPLHGTQVQSLVRELRSCKPRGAAKKNYVHYAFLHIDKKAYTTHTETARACKIFLEWRIDGVFKD